VRIEPLAVSSRALLRALHLLPSAWAEESLAFGALAQGVLRPSRLRRAYRWALRRPGVRRPRRLALALLAERGRFLAAATQVGVRGSEDLHRRIVVEGREHLEAAGRRGGALLVGLHLGSAATALALKIAGYPVVFTGRGRGPLWPRAPARFIVPAAEDLIQWTDLASRVKALRRIERRLLAGDMVYMAADGDGQDAFPLALPGGDLTVRAGWLAVRRRTKIAALPVLGRSERRRVHVRVYPPFPEIGPDPSDDAAACRAHLQPIVEDFVRRWPEQCFMLALGRPASAPVYPGATAAPPGKLTGHPADSSPP
jgi:lauroyl/myristoyl acyltransferase